MEEYLKTTVSLREFLAASAPGLKERLEIFIAICQDVRRVHAKQMVHNDINADTCRIDPAEKSASIACSALAAPPTCRKDKTFQKSAGRISGRIEFISPERTGRTGHPVDFRSDGYSLGVVLYQLLTGMLPFAYEEPLEIIHAHIALPPVPVSEINPEIPPVLSKITAKLLAKNPADRYQGMAGLIFDLKECLRHLQPDGTMGNFPLAQKDVSPIFELPTRLYGRYREVRQLCDAYKAVRGGKVGALFISGAPGIGKSFLVNHLQSLLFESNGYFVSGKFDQYETTIPYSAVTQAFSGLMRKLLTLSEAALEKRRNAISNALGKDGRVIIDVIPELELIIGPLMLSEKEGAPDGWRIDLAGVEARLPETIVALLTQRLRKLSAQTQEILKIAACIATRFYPDLLTTVCCLPMEGIHNLRQNGQS